MRSNLSWSGRGAAMVVIVVALAGAAACGGGDADPSDEPRASDPTSVADERSSTTVDPVEDIGEEFAKAFAAYDSRALELVAPGSVAYLYTDGAFQLQHASHATVGTATAASAGGWQLSDGGPRLSDFVVVEGKIADLSRNGVPLSKTVVPGDGQKWTSVPNEWSDWTGSVTGWIHSIRYFDGNVQLLTITQNDSDLTNTSLDFFDYAAGGQQYSSGGSDSALPGITLASLNVFEDAPPGGTAYGQLSNTSGDVDPVVTVPPLG
jgi:hypothetical protein